MTRRWSPALHVDRFERVSANGIEPNIDWPEHLAAPAVEQVEACRAWLCLFGRKQKTFSNRRTSYGLKHAVERWTRTLPGGEQYVANGAFIEAARLEGYRVRRSGDGSINAVFDLHVSRGAP